MAVVKFSVIILVLLQQVFSVYGNCADFDGLKNCNDCIRCGGYWCNDPYEARCTLSRYNNWCLGKEESVSYLSIDDEIGTYFEPKSRVRTLKVGRDDQFTITYLSESKQPKVELVVNSTQTSNFRVTNHTSCYDGSCTTIIKTSPDTNFCTVNGGPSEYFNVKMSVEGIKEEAVMKFHVPCACACSEKVEVWSPVCNGRGNSTCGVCTCEQGWQGIFCENPICEHKRGDVSCRYSVRNNMECSGNGVCGPCDMCECFTDREGSRYFDKNNFCEDICMTVNVCDDCFLDPRPGRCQTCNFGLFRQSYNESLMSQKDDLNRNIWVKCNETINDCNYVYAAMRDENDETFFMVIQSCDPTQEKQAGAVSDKKCPWSASILNDGQDWNATDMSQSILSSQKKPKKDNIKKDETCDDCKIVTDNIGNEDRRNVLFGQLVTEELNIKKDETCDDCKIVTDNIGNEDRRNVLFGQLVTEKLNHIKPCLRTRTYSKILAFLNDAKGSHSSEIKYDTQI